MLYVLNMCLLVQVPTVDGPVDLKIPAGTQPGTTLLMAKRGVPKLGAGKTNRGDQQVSFLMGFNSACCLSCLSLDICLESSQSSQVCYQVFGVCI